jgi:hypothetical protein
LDFIKQPLAESEGYNSHLLFDLISANTDRITVAGMRTYLEDRVAANEREIY